MRSGGQPRRLWYRTLLCGMALAMGALSAGAIVAYDSPGPPGMQVIFLLSTVKSALETYCPAGDQQPLCTELEHMAHQLEQFQAGRFSAVEPIGSLSEVRLRERAIEAELERRRWDPARLAW